MTEYGSRKDLDGHPISAATRALLMRYRCGY
jgi:hypothetical protein